MVYQLLMRSSLVFDDSKLEDLWRPENDGGKFYGPTRIREALYRSRNLVSIRLLRRMGIDRTLQGLQKFGFETGAQSMIQSTIMELKI